ncbi:hypothetical protein M758_2G111300 [Ceratodon purpureus]|nr:hypothetical protein M758_2G111300 [Ceratodon purpureus]
MAGYRETRREAEIVNDTDKNVEFVQWNCGDSTKYGVLGPGQYFTYSTLDNGTYGYLQVRPEHKQVHGLVIESNDVHHFSKISVAVEHGSYVLKKEDRPAEEGVVSRVSTAISKASGAVVSRVKSFNFGRASQPNPSNEAQPNPSNEAQPNPSNEAQPNPSNEVRLDNV